MDDPIYRRASEPEGSLIAGVVNAFTIIALFCVVIAMLWIMISNAFAGALSAGGTVRGINAGAIESTRSRMDALMQSSMKLGEQMYKGADDGEAGPGTTAGAGGSKPDDGVVDVDFEEVDDDKKRSQG